jgi:hypothetical protein
MSLKMQAWDFTVGTLSVAGRTSASAESQAIAESIVENHLLSGSKVTRGITHYAVDQTAVDLGEE